MRSSVVRRLPIFVWCVFVGMYNLLNGKTSTLGIIGACSCWAIGIAFVAVSVILELRKNKGKE